MLTLAGRLYGKIADLRNALYKKGVLKSRSLGVKTISVGNITAGGTGKTPLVAHIAGSLLERGETVCILTRGYGRKDPNSRVLVADGSAVLADAETAGDEPAELALKLNGRAIIIADPDRVSAGLWAKEKFGVTVFILDDGFQHRRVKRDLDIVCIDATDPFGGGNMLPAGRLREPLHNLLRADAVVITRADMASDISRLGSEVAGLNRTASIFTSVNKISSITELGKPHSGQPESDLDILRSHLVGGPKNADGVVRALAFCALGNPKSFFNLLLELDDSTEDFDLSIIKDFPDHHFYSQSEISELEREARACGVDVLLTTAKDAVKLHHLRFSLPCYVVEIETVLHDEAAFRSLL